MEPGLEEKIAYIVKSDDKDYIKVDNLYELFMEYKDKI
jgi:hypothetical protein